MKFSLFVSLLLVSTLVLTGCAGKMSSGAYLREDVDYSFIQRIAVLPFENNSEDKFAPERTRDISITQVLDLGLFDSVEKGLVDNVLFEEAVEQGRPIDPLTLKRIGQRLQVQAFLIGTVDISGTSRIGATTYPQLGLTMRLIEVESGMILWQASGYKSGESFVGRLLGTTPADMYKVTRDLVTDLLRTAPAGGI